MTVLLIPPKIVRMSYDCRFVVMKMFLYTGYDMGLVVHRVALAVYSYSK